MRIRKITPNEAWRLMGFSDDDFIKASSVCSDSQLYHQAGNSIVVNVIYELLKKLLVEDYLKNLSIDILWFLQMVYKVIVDIKFIPIS